MSACVLFIGLVLTSQVNGADSRYDVSGAGKSGPSAPPALGNSTNPLGGNPASAARSPIGNGGAAAGASGNTGGGAISNDGLLNGFGGSSAASSQPPRQLLPLDNDTGPISGAASSRPTAAAYEAGQPPGAAPPAGTGLTASQMMRAMLSPQQGTKLSGQSVPLVEVIAGARSRGEQTQRVEAYWDLCSSVADYYLGLREQYELHNYVQGGGQALEQFELEMRNRTGTSLHAASASQMRLANLMGRGNDFLPLPADALHCASYNTRYEQIFPRGGPAEAKELATLLPLRYTELKGAATSVVDSEQYLNSFATSRRGDIDGGLHALNLLALRRRAFVQIARDYNRRIARYSELASPGPIAPDRLVGILIKSNVATATKSGAAAPPVNRQSNSGPPPQWTFADGSKSPVSSASNAAKRDEAVRRASGAEESTAKESTSRLPESEHSLLVKPQK